MLLIRSFSPTKVLLSHSLNSSIPIPSLDHNGLTFSKLIGPSSTSFRKFFASFEFDASPCWYEPLHTGVTFRLGGVEREMSLIELGWIVGLYSEGESRDVVTLSGLRGAETPPPHVYRKTSLVKMGVIMKLHEGECCWLATREVVEEGEGDDEEGDGEGGNEGFGGFADIYFNISQGDWQVRQTRWMDQLYLMRRSLEVLRKFHGTILG
ncbi:hypothetical protein Tco_1213653 [Tanacetum coccineum]